MRPGAEAGRAGRLDADEPHVRDPRRSRRTSPIAFEPPPTQAIDGVGQPALGGEDLLARLVADHALEVAHELGVRRRADARADQVVRRLDVRDPVADRLARRLLQRLRAELDRAHLGAEQVHPLDVRGLAAHVLGAHVDDAVEAEARADRGGGDAVLAGAGLGDDPLLAEPLREHGLAERVVQLVRAGVEQVLALEVDAPVGVEARGARERRGAAGVVRARARAAPASRTRRPSPPPSRRSARRAPGSASRARSARRRCRRSGVIGPPPPRRGRRRGP